MIAQALPLSRWHIMIIATVLALFAGAVPAAEDPDDGDIRGLRIGMNVKEVNNENYQRVNCVVPDTGGKQADIATVSDFQMCPADSSGLVPVQVHYAPIEPWSNISDRFQGTKLAGHPVNLYVRVGPEGTIKALMARTDPEARRYLRKKAFLLSLRIKGRYGRENWHCKRDKPSDERQRVGGMFIDETCEKQLEGRRLIVHTRLYRESDQDQDESTSGTLFEILGPDVQRG